MVLLLTILIAFISVLLILVILIQNPKGGGLNASFGGAAANQMVGAANSTDMLEKVTWGLASSLLLLCLATGVFFKGGTTATTVGEEINTNVTQPVTNQPTNGGLNVPVTGNSGGGTTGNPTNGQ